MFTIFQQKERSRKILFAYWLIVPILFGMYLTIMSLDQDVSISELISTIPSLAISLIIALLQIFQAFGLYLLNSTQEAKGAILGKYLKFSMFQQLVTFNFIGLFLCGIYYWQLPTEKKQETLPLARLIPLYLIIGFIGILTLFILFIRFSM